MRLKYLCRSLAVSPLLVNLLVVAVAGQEDGDALGLPRNPIVFVHHSDSARKDYDIWQIAADGTQLASVVVLPNHQSQFAISPDGNEIIYVDMVNGKRDLWRRKFSGGDSVNITKSPSDDSSPQWSLDGNRVLFSSDRDSEKPELYTMSLDTGQVTRITNNQFYDSDACWAPDSKAIIFSRFIPGDEKEKSSGHGMIMEYDLASKTEQQLTDLGGYCGGVDYSPDGKQIAFHRVADGAADIWFMNSDGTDQRQITKTFIDEYSPAWSPDGRWLVYTAGTGHDGLGTFDLWLMDSDGNQRQVLSTAANTQMSPDWRKGTHFMR